MTQECPGWRCDFKLLSGKQQERQGTGKLLGTAGTSKTLCWRVLWLEYHHMQHCPNPALPSSSKYNLTRDFPAVALPHSWGLAEVQEIWSQVHITWGMQGIPVHIYITPQGEKHTCYALKIFPLKNMPGQNGLAFARFNFSFGNTTCVCSNYPVRSSTKSS